mgnify:CR=1 FL=1
MNGYVSVKEASHKWEIPEHGTNYGKSREKSEKTFDPVPVEIGWEADRCDYR